MMKTIAKIVVGLLCSIAFTTSASATIVDSSSVIRANFSPTALYDGIALEVGFVSPFTPSAGQSMRISAFDSMGNSFFSATRVFVSSGLPYFQYDVNTGPNGDQSFYVVLDQFVGSFDIQQIGYYPYLGSYNYDFPNSQAVGDGRPIQFIVSQVQPVPEPTTLLLFAAALAAAVWTFRRNRDAVSGLQADKLVSP